MATAVIVVLLYLSRRYKILHFYLRLCHLSPVKKNMPIRRQVQRTQDLPCSAQKLIKIQHSTTTTKTLQQKLFAQTFYSKRMDGYIDFLSLKHTAILPALFKKLIVRIRAIFFLDIYFDVRYLNFVNGQQLSVTDTSSRRRLALN